MNIFIIFILKIFKRNKEILKGDVFYLHSCKKKHNDLTRERIFINSIILRGHYLPR